MQTQQSALMLFFVDGSNPLYYGRFYKAIMFLFFCSKNRKICTAAHLVTAADHQINKYYISVLISRGMGITPVLILRGHGMRNNRGFHHFGNYSSNKSPSWNELHQYYISVLVSDVCCQTRGLQMAAACRPIESFSR